MPNLYTLNKEFRAALLAALSRASSEMVRVYGRAYVALREDLDALMGRMHQAQSDGTFSPSWLYQERRMESLLDQVRQQIGLFSQFAGAHITAEQVRAAQLGQSQARQLVLASLGAPPGGSLALLHTAAVEDLAGFLSDGSPLAALLDTLAGQAAENVKDAHTSGIAAGQGPRDLAADMRRQLRGALGPPLSRALTIARTETLRAYRTASSRTYQANSDVVDGWIWTAHLSSRTCALCIAMNGTEHPGTEEFASHPNCRCSPVPKTKSWQDLGIEGVPEAAAPPVSGADWFAAQDEKTQMAILGPAKFAAYKAGKLSLAGLVGKSDDSRWGPSRYEKSLADAIK